MRYHKKPQLSDGDEDDQQNDNPDGRLCVTVTMTVTFGVRVYGEGYCVTVSMVVHSFWNYLPSSCSATSILIFFITFFGGLLLPFISLYLRNYHQTSSMHKNNNEGMKTHGRRPNKKDLLKATKTVIQRWLLLEE